MAGGRLKEIFESSSQSIVSSSFMLSMLQHSCFFVASLDGRLREIQMLLDALKIIECQFICPYIGLQPFKPLSRPMILDIGLIDASLPSIDSKSACNLCLVTEVTESFDIFARDRLLYRYRTHRKESFCV